MKAAYEYMANWVRVIDGNTLILNVDLGLHTAHIGPFQLLSVEAFPVSGKDRAVGLKEKEKLETILLNAGELRITTHKPDKYGRWLAELFFTDEKGVEHCVNKLMMEN